MDLIKQFFKWIYYSKKEVFWKSVFILDFVTIVFFLSIPQFKLSLVDQLREFTFTS